jgi:Ser/Thr protein kinase RdoA (MazF antagonist)
MFGRGVSGGTTQLYLEQARAFCPWPWPDTALAARVCRQLAQLHDVPELPRTAFSWNYEDALLRSAEDTLTFAAGARDPEGRRVWRRLGDLRRVVGALPDLRRQLLSAGTTVIHGDIHPGNVILRASGSGIDVVLIDWARARAGSPLEDVASWLHSLGCWEPQARRRHDTLLRAYLDARAAPPAFDATVRVNYGLAAVSNGLSGAIRYHLSVLATAGTSEPKRRDSHRALAAWTRVVRHAAVLVRITRHRWL